MRTLFIFSAHWDHFGQKGANVYSGARDNALSVATVLELAKQFVALPERKMGTVFLLPTAEEQGLLGSKYFVSNLDSLYVS
jgi:Zn-dependent M28 family amino/carboxypeptidase